VQCSLVGTSRNVINTWLSRRSFINFLLCSPLVLPDKGLARELGRLGQEEISQATDALNVFDFESVAKQKLNPAHYTYLSMGVEDELTLKANREGFKKYRLRPRRLVDVRELDTATDIFGAEFVNPIILAPVGSQRAYHPEGELAVARAAKRQNSLQILSMSSSTPIEDIVEANGSPPWYQLYGQRSWPVNKYLLRRAENANCRAVVLTVDIVGLPSNRERIDRFHRERNPECQPCHNSVGDRLLEAAKSFSETVGLDAKAIIAESMMLDWAIVDQIRDTTSMKLVIKGILAPEDAQLCVEHGVDAIIVSNHGGRAEDNGTATIEVLPEIVRAVDGRIPVLIDSGFRRGSDIYKALALGATAVCIGRPYIWGLASFGQEGVEAVLSMLTEELHTIMRQMGTPDLNQLKSSSVQKVS